MLALLKWKTGQMDCLFFVYCVVFKFKSRFISYEMHEGLQWYLQDTSLSAGFIKMFSISLHAFTHCQQIMWAKMVPQLMESLINFCCKDLAKRLKYRMDKLLLLTSWWAFADHTESPNGYCKHLLFSQTSNILYKNIYLIDEK